MASKLARGGAATGRVSMGEDIFLLCPQMDLFKEMSIAYVILQIFEFQFFKMNSSDNMVIFKYKSKSK